MKYIWSFMSKLLLIIPLLLCFFGFSITLFIIYLTGVLSGLGFFIAFIVGCLVGIVECILIRKYSGSLAKYFYLDGEIFPFLSVGVLVAMLIF